MARLARVAPVGVPQHIIQRGNNRQVCFAGEEDMKAYLHWLKEMSKKYQVDIHAWVLMTNHVHLLCTPWKENAVSQMMQSLGRLYVRYFNHTYQRSGTLWEGRFKSCLVQSERYLLELYRYIELNPVRADMVDKPSDYSWSSYAINALGVESTYSNGYCRRLQRINGWTDCCRWVCRSHGCRALGLENLINIRRSSVYRWTNWCKKSPVD